MATDDQSTNEGPMAEPQPTSWWWCRKCHAYVDLVDPGEVYPHCEDCRGRVHLREPAERMHGQSRPTREALPQVDWSDVENGARGVERPKPRKGLSRLPMEKRDLRVLARTGWWFCYECQQITELTGDGAHGGASGTGQSRPTQEEGECALCGSGMEKKINWNEPAFKDEPAPVRKTGSEL